MNSIHQQVSIARRRLVIHDFLHRLAMAWLVFSRWLAWPCLSQVMDDSMALRRIRDDRLFACDSCRVTLVVRGDLVAYSFIDPGGDGHRSANAVARTAQQYSPNA